MELREFIKNSLVDIVGGVSDASNEVENLGGCVNFVHSQDQATQNVKFDIAVTVSESKSNEVGGGVSGGISVIAIKAGGQVSSETVSGQESRISFSVPVVLPNKQSSTPSQPSIRRPGPLEL